MSRLEQAKLVVDTLVNDLRDRAGLRQAWDGIDDDVRADILKAWADIVYGGLVSV